MEICNRCGHTTGENTSTNDECGHYKTKTHIRFVFVCKKCGADGYCYHSWYKMSLFGSIEYGPYVCKKCGAKGGCNHEWIQDTETIFECKDCGKFGLYRGVDDNFRDELIDKRFTLPWNKLRHELKLWHDKDEKYEYNITHG